MIEIRRYRPEDYMKINRRKFDLLTFLNFPDPEAISKNLGKGPAFTAIANGEIIACGGIVPFWKGVGEGWVVTSELLNLYRLTFAKTVWRLFYRLIKEMNLDRVQTTIDAENVISQAWVERMGFEYEGPMRKYIDGRTFYRYAWVRS
jgi:hypothetical protein